MLYRCLINWVVGIALWFLFVYTFSLYELLAGMGVAAITLISLELALRAVRFQFRPKAKWLARMSVLPMTVAKDMLILIKALALRLTGKPIPSLFLVTHFSALAEDARSAAKRALAVGITTVSPNSVVVDIDCDTGLLLFHELEKTSVPKTIEELQESA